MFGPNISVVKCCFNQPIKNQYWNIMYRQLIYYLLHCHRYLVCKAGTSTRVIGIRESELISEKNLFDFRLFPKKQVYFTPFFISFTFNS